MRCYRDGCKKRGRLVCEMCQCVLYCNRSCMKADKTYHESICAPSLPSRFRIYMETNNYNWLASNPRCGLFHVDLVRKDPKCKRCVICQKKADMEVHYGQWERFKIFLYCQQCANNSNGPCYSSYMGRRQCFRRFVTIVLGLKLPRDVNQLLFRAINNNKDCVYYHPIIK